MVSKRKIVQIYNRGKKMQISGRNIKSEFDLSDLVGESISNHEVVERKRDNPKYLDVVYFSSGRVLITGVEGWQDGSTYHNYLIGIRWGVKYSWNLFDAGLRDIVAKANSRNKLT